MRNILLGIGAIALIAVGIYTFSSPDEPSLISVSEVIAQSPTFTYETFTQERYDELLGEETFAIFFHSESCGTCAKKEEQIIEEVDEFTGGVILKQEFSEAPTDLLQTFGVTSYDTFVIVNHDATSTTIPGAKIMDVRDAIGAQGMMENDENGDDALMMDEGEVKGRQVLAESDVFSYETFSEDRFNDLRGKDAFAVFFHSETCGTCAKKNQTILDEVDAFEGGVILKQEYSEVETSLLQELGVTSYDTFVIFDEDGSFETHLGATIDEVREEIN